MWGGTAASAVQRSEASGVARTSSPASSFFPQTSSRKPGEAIFALLLLRFELALSCSRDAPTSFSTPPKNHSSAAMCVQPSAVALKPIPYMVLYCLTPPQFHRYSSLTLCPPYPAWAENVAGNWRGRNRSMHRTEERNPVSKHACPGHRHANARPNDRPFATDNWPLVVRSSRCSN